MRWWEERRGGRSIGFSIRVYWMIEWGSSKIGLQARSKSRSWVAVPYVENGMNLEKADDRFVPFAQGLHLLVSTFIQPRCV